MRADFSLSWLRNALIFVLLLSVSNVGHANPVESSIDQLLLIRRLITNPSSFDFYFVDRGVLRSLVSDVFATMDARHLPIWSKSRGERWWIALSAERFKMGHPALWEGLTGDSRSGVDYARVAVHREITENTSLGFVHAGSGRSDLSLKRFEVTHHAKMLQSLDLRYHAGFGHLDINRVGQALSADAGMQVIYSVGPLSTYMGVLFGRSRMGFSRPEIDSVLLSRTRLSLGIVVPISATQNLSVETGDYQTGQRYLTANYSVYF